MTRPVYRFIQAAWIILAAAVPSFPQSATKEATPITKKATAPDATPDTWERSKECAAQAEKVVAERNRRSASFGAHGLDWWSNHYSPKYSRCFVKAEFIVGEKDSTKGGPLIWTYLIDAFENSDVASWAVGVIPSAGYTCRQDDKPEECRDKTIAALAWGDACKIEDEPADCAKAEQFIKEHMKN
ncbi:MAG: hypothetical protein ABSH49_02860 [Bryobacteraceae bacterium]|jgi:hypothetical protein